MKASFFTPTHNPQWLDELYRSIAAQTIEDWEWIIVPNNGAAIPPMIDPRVRVVPYTGFNTGIGALKRFACERARGRILIEVDHDDMLKPNCLERLWAAFSDDSIGFAHSGWTGTEASWHLGRPNTQNPSSYGQPYGLEYGWEFGASGASNWAIPFDVDAAALSRIYFAPNHVRAWRTSAYWAAGGHDDRLSLCDDHELLCRTYLTTQCKTIPECLYVQRDDIQSTSRGLVNQIATETVSVFYKYGYRLFERDAELQGLQKLDLGGRFDCPAGYISVDLKGAAVQADLRWSFPFADNSAGVIRAHDLIEHLPDGRHTMSECHRVLCDGGWLVIMVPSADGRGAFQDPTHCSFWNENSFFYWTRRNQAKYIDNDSVGFQAMRLETLFPSDWHRDHKLPYVCAWLRAIKSNARRPGLNLFTRT